ncbi:Inositol 2-dehydrogenase 3 protein [Marine Group I thaumarchaeote SCGC AAA799-B03]|uniref:Inositol 2-dehydrogenase 3 protein n=1 Tax=Marine Group I thaumarchaeote SCGC AAA799-B03 TaxID=1502289 RepID=A0A087S924_9ARCH|nr:Inositol 2-dehydrogenase 3 protein [Marine Group I thaumarchaeote SCGC AAA799-B03]
MIKPRVILIGAGKFGKNHVKTLAQLDKDGRCEFSGVVDKDSHILSEISKNYDIQTSTCIEDLMNNADAVVIATPASTHFNLTIDCLSNNKHVFVEKPVALNYADALQMHQKAISKSKILMVGNIFRHHVIIKSILKNLHDDGIGKIRILDGEFLNTADARTDVGSLLNYIHHLDLFCYIMKISPTSISCQNFFATNNNFEDYCTLTLTYPENIVATIRVGWLGLRKSRNFTITGSKKTLFADLVSNTVTYYSGSNKEGISENMEKFELNAKNLPLYLELDNFIDSIQNNTSPLSDSESSLLSIKLAEKALESAQSQKTIYLQ